MKNPLARWHDRTTENSSKTRISPWWMQALVLGKVGSIFAILHSMSFNYKTVQNNWSSVIDLILDRIFIPGLVMLGLSCQVRCTMLMYWHSIFWGGCLPHWQLFRLLRHCRLFSALTSMLPVWKELVAFRQLEILALSVNHSNQFDL